jgi:hypothetical protein
MSMQSLVKAEREVTTKWRERIQGSQLLNRLIDHCEGRLDLSMSQCNTSLRLIDKIMPSLQAVSVETSVKFEGLGRWELDARMLAMGIDPQATWDRLSNKSVIDVEPVMVKSIDNQHDSVHVDKHDQNQQPIEGTTPSSDESESSS